MISDDIEQIKAGLRAGAHHRRAALSATDRADAAKAACLHFFEQIELDSDAVVAAYWAIRDEIDCQPILVRLMDSNQRVCLPVVGDHEAPLDFRVWEQGSALYPAGFGTLAPEAHAPKAVPDIIVMPLLGFDDRGTRLGYGGGYYDRTLAQMATRPRLIGLAFDAQKLPNIPRADHDIPLDAVVTESGVLHFGAAS